MSDPSNSETTLDSNFVEAIKIMKENDVPYWVCHGTLLGLIRDGNLIPWDHDIDFGIWSGAFSKISLIEMMVANGFSLKDDGADFDSVSFTKGDSREIDFNFYHVTPETDIAFVEWAISKSKFATLVKVIAKKTSYAGKFSGVVNFLSIFSPFASALDHILMRLGLSYVSAGYTTPASLLRDIKYIELEGLQINVPSLHDEVLVFLYGEDWKIPKEQYDWITESPSTRVSESRFS